MKPTAEFVAPLRSAVLMLTANGRGFDSMSLVYAANCTTSRARQYLTMLVNMRVLTFRNGLFEQAHQFTLWRDMDPRTRPVKPRSTYAARRQHEFVKDAGVQVRAARMALGWTRRQLADKVGLTYNSLRNIEQSGRRNRVSPSLWHELKRALGLR